MHYVGSEAPVHEVARGEEVQVEQDEKRSSWLVTPSP